MMSSHTKWRAVFQFKTQLEELIYMYMWVSFLVLRLNILCAAIAHVYILCGDARYCEQSYGIHKILKLTLDYCLHSKYTEHSFNSYKFDNFPSFASIVNHLVSYNSSHSRSFSFDCVSRVLDEERNYQYG